MNARLVHGVLVHGVRLDAETRCSHWNSALDIVAIKFKCCGEFYACFECHRELTDHEAKVWPASEFEEQALLCGTCGFRLTICDYLALGSSACPKCESEFNAGCSRHRHLYFETA